jgi:hypothetical protein
MNGKSEYIEGIAKATSAGKNCMLSMYSEKKKYFDLSQHVTVRH